MTEPQRALLNRRISEKRGYRVDMLERGIYVTVFHGERINLIYSTEDEAWRCMPDWTGRDGPNCALLDEIPQARLMHMPALAESRDLWYVDSLAQVGKIGHEDRRLAVALGWAYWQQINLEGIVEPILETR